MHLQAFAVAAVCCLLGSTTTALPLAAHEQLEEKRGTSVSSLPAPIPQYSVPTSLPNVEFVPDPFDYDAIRNTMALYPFCIDGKNFAALSQVFTSDAVANYSAPLNVLTPLSNIESVLSSSLAKVTTQHALTTQAIDITGVNTAETITYYTASHFGTGSYVGQVAYAYGQYQDYWNRQSDGSWRISYRNLVYMAPVIGNLAIFS